MDSENTQDDWLNHGLTNYSVPNADALRRLNMVLSVVVLFFLFLAPALVSLLLGLKAGLLFGGLYSGAMFVNASVTNLSNALVGRDLGGDYDLFWRLLFIIASALSFAAFSSI